MAIIRSRFARSICTFWSAPALSRFSPAAAVIVVLLGAVPVLAKPQKRISEVDGWLAAHPDVASTMIWEFPPTKEIRIPLVPPRKLRWPFRGIGPDPVFIDALSESVLPELVVTRPRDPIPGALEAALPSADQTNAARAQLNVVSNKAFAEAAPSAAASDGPPILLPGGIKKSEYGAEIRAWKHWPEWAQDELRARYADYRAWLNGAWPLYQDFAASGFTTKPPGFDAVFSTTLDPDPSPVPDPPFNLQPDDPLVDGVPWAMVHSQSAFALYVRLVAAQLAMEIGGCLPWSLAGYVPADLRPLFDGRMIFRYVPEGPSEWGTMTATGHIVTTTVTPAPPLVVLGFLAQHGLIGANRLETIVRLLDWERNNLRHVVGGTPATPLGSGVLFFGYNGRPPVSRMINGTVMAEPVMFSGGFTYYEGDVLHWVGGCGGASGFNEQVFRLVNVAAEQTALAHFQNRFSLGNGVYVGLAHADDPYGIHSAPEIPTAEILLDDATYQAWFVDESDPAARLKNVGRRTADLYLQYLPEILLYKHCLDINIFNNDHASSLVYNFAFSATYTVEEMEAMGLWTGIEAKLSTLGGCGIFGFQASKGTQASEFPGVFGAAAVLENEALRFDPLEHDALSGIDRLARTKDAAVERCPLPARGGIDIGDFEARHHGLHRLGSATGIGAVDRRKKTLEEAPGLSTLRRRGRPRGDARFSLQRGIRAGEAVPFLTNGVEL